MYCKGALFLESLFKDITSTNFPKYWELMFDKLFITPILSKIDSKVQNHVSLIRKIRKTEENPVLRYSSMKLTC